MQTRLTAPLTCKGQLLKPLRLKQARYDTLEPLTITAKKVDSAMLCTCTACALARVQRAEMQAKLDRVVTAEDTGLSQDEHDK